MGDYLIILAFDDRDSNELHEEMDDDHDNEDEDRDAEVEPLENIARLLAVDLRDLSVQEVRLDEWEENYQGNYIYYGSRYILQKFNENQIILFEVSDNYRCSHMLTIESFQRKTYPVLTLSNDFSSSFR